MINGLVLPLKDLVLFSKGQVQIAIDKEHDRELQKAIQQNGGYAIGLTLKEHIEETDYTKDDFYHIGNRIKIRSSNEVDGKVKLQIDILERVRITELEKQGINFVAEHESLEDTIDVDPKSLSDMVAYVRNLIKEMGKNIPGSEGFILGMEQIEDMNALISALMPYIYISTEEKQSVLEMVSLRKKSLRFIDILIERKEQLKIQVELNSKINSTMNQNYRERVLREQLKSIQDELDSGEDGENKKDYKSRILEAKLPELVEKTAIEEAKKLERMGGNNAEANVARNYLDLILELPWKTESLKDIEIDDARKTLNERHYGLDKVKDRIIQHITVMKLKKNKQGSILLLVGPPGTGKTSLAKSIANALDREYVRISLGGVRDEAEIRGHRKTYIGAMPGKIIQGMKRAGSKNPVFVLDEVDKLIASGHGDPSSALLEVLDPEQNNTFNDHYLDLPYDLSDVFFIATANDLRTIQGPLRDRMEIIDIGSYTSVEKFHIGKEHLFDISLEDHGLEPDDIKVSDNALKSIIDKYTREAGVRNLKRQLDKLVRVSSEKLVTGKVEKPYRVKENMLQSILGHPLVRVDMVDEKNPVGVVTGMAWTPVGGDILYIESAFIPGKGNLLLTGKLGDVMKESARISLSLVKSRLYKFMETSQFDKMDLHIHVPAGATPKDGPSAGVTMLTTIASLITNKPVDSKLAMTGEVSLRGAVLPVGGIKEKVIAAHRSGIKKILLPADNKRDMEDVPVEVKNDVDFIFVKRIEEVLKEALGLEIDENFGSFLSRQDDKKEDIGFN